MSRHGYMPFLFGLLLVAFTTCQYTPLPLVNQTNGYTLYYDLTNRIECHNYTDIWGFPLVYVADDFLIPLYEQLDAYVDCIGVSFSFTTIRLKVDTDPYSIALRLFRHNASTNGPSDTPFYENTRCSPTGSCAWPTRLNVPLTTTIVINNGDSNDVNTSSPFDMTMLPLNETIWAAMYVTVPDHPSTSILRENSLFWMTLDNKSSSTPLQPLFYGSTPNYNYKYIDVNNLHRHGFTQWTDATQIQPILGISTTTYNMAWTVSLMCDANITNRALKPIVVPTEAPTAEPTSVPTTQRPTPSPTNEADPPSDAPTGVPTTTDTVPIDTNQSRYNDTTAWYERLKQEARKQTILYATIGTILLCCCLCTLGCICIKWRAYRKKHGPVSVAQYLSRYRSNGGGTDTETDTEIEMNPLTTFSEYQDEREADNQPQVDDYSSKIVTRRQVPDTKRQSWTDRVFTEVSLEGDTQQGGDNEQQFNNYIMEIAPNNIGVIDASKKKDI